jgi:hypothetical protein
MPSKLIVSALAALFLFSMLMQGSSRARASEISCAITWNELSDDEKPKNFAGYFDETFGHYDAPTLAEDEPSYDSLWPSGRRPNPTTCVGILIKGKIETGDAAKFLELLGPNYPFVKKVFLWSPGGYVAEAMRIGRIIRKNMLTTWAPVEVGDDPVGNGLLVDPTDHQVPVARYLCQGTGCNCASACFLIWAAGVQRWGNALGLHRPTTSSTDFTDLPPDQASAAYRQWLSVIETYLSEMEIPRRYIEKLTDTSSNTISWVGWKDAFAMTEPPSIREWLLASCGGLSGEELDIWIEGFMHRRLSPDLSRKADQAENCETTKIENYKDSAKSPISTSFNTELQDGGNDQEKSNPDHPLLRLLMGGAVITVVFAVLASVGAKYFARSLPYSKAFLICLVAFAVGTVLFIVYTFVRLLGDWSERLDGLFLLVVMCVAGDIITKLARNYGIEKTGRLGVGAKAVFTLFVLSWLIVSVVYVGSKLIS